MYLNGYYYYDYHFESHWRRQINMKLTHLPLMPHICVNVSMNKTSNGSGNGLVSNKCQTNADLSIGPLETHLGEIRIKIQNFSLMKMHLKVSSVKMAAILSRWRWAGTPWYCWHDYFFKLIYGSLQPIHSTASPIQYHQHSKWIL